MVSASRRPHRQYGPGTWHFVVIEGGSGGVTCEVVMNPKGLINTNLSTCDEFSWNTLETAQFSLENTRLFVNSLCRVTGTLNEDGGEAPATVEGQMIRGGEFIQGRLTYDNGPEDQGNLTFTAVKIK